MSKISLLMSAIDNISPATKSASQSQQKLSDQLTATRKEASSVNKTLSQIASYEKNTGAVEKARAANERYSKQLKAQQDAIKRTRKPTLEQANALAELEQKVTDSGIALRDKSRALRNLESDLKSAGIDTSNLANAQDLLTEKSERYRREIKKQVDEYRNLKTAQKDATAANKEWADKKEQIADRVAVAATATLTASGMAAISDEKAYADVKKVMSGSEIEHKENRQWAHELSSSKAAGGKTAQDIYAIQGNLARAGHTDTATNQAMTKDVMKMAVAFDMDDTKEAAEKYNAMVAALGLNQEQAYDMLGAMNYTSNNLKASGGQLLDSLGRVGGVMKTAGFTSKDSLGILGDMIAKGKAPEEAATSAKNIALAMSKGSSASGTQRDAMLKIGMTPEQLAKDSQQDASGTYIKILERVNSLPKHMQAGVLNDMFGGEAVAAVAAQMQNIGTLKKSLTHSNQSTDTNKASIEKEYQMMLDTRANSIATLMNSLTRLAVIVGEPLLTPIEFVASGLSNLVNGLSKFGELKPAAAAGVVALLGLSTSIYGAKRALDLFKRMREIRAGVVNVYGNNTSDLTGTKTDKSKTDKSKTDKSKSSPRRGLRRVAGLRGMLAGSLLSSTQNSSSGVAGNAIKGAATTAMHLGGGGLGFLLGATKDYDPESSALAKANSSDAAKNAYMAMYAIPEIPESTATIPTPEQFDKKAAEVRAIEQTRNVNINFSGKIDGVTPETEALMMEAYKANLQQNTDNNLYDREDY